MAEITVHPWVQNPDVPSEQEVFETFTRVKEKVKKEADNQLRIDLQAFNESRANMINTAPSIRARGAYKSTFSNLQERRE